MQLSSVYLGIDVACAAGKRLPICVVSADPPHTPLIIPKPLAGLIPRGLGNKEIAAEKPFRVAAGVITSALKRIMSEMGWRIERIGIDAPAAAPAKGSRASEDELGHHGLSCFRTPSAAAWPKIRKACADHISEVGSLATLPYANKIWMLFGFELFSCLRRNLQPKSLRYIHLLSCAHCSRHVSTNQQRKGTATGSEL